MKSSYSQKRKIKNIIVHVFLAILAAIWLLPIFWVVLTSFRAEPGSYVDTFFPKSYTFDNYIKLFTDTNVHHGRGKAGRCRMVFQKRILKDPVK